MPVRKIRSRSDAETCLAAAARSGLPRVAWCHANGIDARSLNAWRVNLSRTTKEEWPLRLVEVVAARPSSRPLTVRVGDVSVDVPVGFDEDTLARVLGVLVAC
jgi:hypothetical protein